MTDQPEFLTVPEVMARLRLGRTTVYEQARLYLATGGAEGLPCRRFGRSLRFPAAALDFTDPAPAPLDCRIDDGPAASAPRHPRHSTRSADQLTLAVNS